jgi:CHAD domain-containing protein
MAFEIKPRKSLEKNLRKLVKSQVDKAATALRGEADLPIPEIVHEVRRRFKRIRALARLSKQAIGEEAANRLNERFRDAARPLSELRDANVLVKTLDQLAERWPAADRPEVFAAIGAVLEARNQETRQHAIQREDVFATVLDATMKASREFKRSDFKRDDWNALADGFAHIHGRCSDAFHDAKDDPSDDNLHTWRKRVKDLLYESKMLAPVRPWFFQRFERQADELSELLGEDHDLAVLRQFLVADQSGACCAGSIETILPVLDERRHFLQSAAFSQAPAMLGEDSHEFGDRIHAYWKAWRAEVKAAAFDRPLIGQEV